MKKWIIKVKNNRMTIRVISILFAFFLWLFVMNEINPQMTREIEGVKAIYLNEERLETNNIKLVEPKAVELTVRVSGRRKEVGSLKAEDIEARIDLRGYSEGTVKIPIEVVKPFSADEIVDFYPKDVLFKFDKIVDKNIKVDINLIGNLREGYVANDPIVRPEYVSVKGPKMLVDKIEKGILDIDISGAFSDVEANMAVKLLDEDNALVDGVEVFPNVIDVRVPVLKTKEVSVIPVFKSGVKEGYEMVGSDVIPDKIRIKGNESVIDEIESVETKEIDLKDMFSNKSVRTNLNLIDGVELLSQNQKVDVDLKIEPIIEKVLKVDAKNIVKENIEKGYFVVEDSKDKQKALVKIRGVKSLVEELTENDIRVYSNLKNKKAGEHVVEIKAYGPSGVEIVNIVPSKMKFKVEAIEQ